MMTQQQQQQLKAVDGGHYKFVFNEDPNTVLLGVFFESEVEKGVATFKINLYEQFNDPLTLASRADRLCLLGLPAVRRLEHPFFYIIEETKITILSRIFIVKERVFIQREIQWRIGMKNLFRIADDTEDRRSDFIGMCDTQPGCYIEQERQYLAFRISIVEVAR